MGVIIVLEWEGGLCPPTLSPAAISMVHRSENIVLTKLHVVCYTPNVLPILHQEQIPVCRLESIYKLESGASSAWTNP